MIEFSEWNNPQFKVKLTFDNGEVFETNTNNTNLDSSCCLNFMISETEANLIGNPLGIFTSNTLTLEILDKNNYLIPTNTKSPYYGYIRNGVKIEVYKIDDGLPFGVFYSNSWDVNRESGTFKTVTITADDKLTYIGNIETPELPSYIGLDVKELLKNIFVAIGLTEEEFYIDDSLQLSMSFGITKGEKIREVLNSIAQSLIARITLRRNGVIYVMPAFPNSDPYGVINNDDLIENYTISHNQANIYNKVKLSYNRVTNKPSEIIETLNNVELQLGKNEFNNIEISQNVLNYDGVYVEYEADNISYDDKITNISFKGYQGGISISIESAKTEPFIANIEIAGRLANATDSYVESDIKTTDAKVANPLILDSFVIQNETDAKAYVNKVVAYLEKISHQLNINGLFSTEIEPGMYILINSEVEELAGKYYVTGYNLTCGEGSTTSLQVLKMRG